MRLRILWALLVVFLLPVRLRAAGHSELPQDDTVERIAGRIERAVDEELQRLRSSLRGLIARELGLEEAAAEEETLRRALEAIDPDWMQRTLEPLASDEMAGRRAGSPQEERACAYIAERFHEFGLRPVGDPDETGQPTYFQGFAIGGNRSRNCVGLLEGSDEALRDEILIVGGHHDHLGIGRSFGALGPPQEGDDIYNGADDNASGVTTVLAVARAFHESGLRPRRSILFMTFGAEEMGLIGSRHYVRHPIFPLENTVAMINLDMVGRNSGQRVHLYGVGTADIFQEVAQAAATASGLRARLVEGATLGFGDSDHSAFLEAGVPAMFFFTGLHRQYHRVTDHADLIEYDHMAAIGRAAFLILWDLAQRDERPRPRIEPRRRSRPQGLPEPAPAGRMLGVETSTPTAREMDAMGLGAEEGAVVVERVRDGSAARRAGIQEGDTIVRFRDQALPRSDPLGALRRMIGEAPAGTDIPVEVIREGRRIRLMVRWDR